MRALSPVVVLVLMAAGQVPAQAQERQASPTAILHGGPEVGRRAPDFTLPWASRDGVGPADAPYQLWRDRGKTVVIAFYPRDFTSGCTAQMRTFTEQYDSLFAGEVVVVGINTDSLATHSRFAASLGVPFRLLSDPGQKVARKYGSSDNSGFPRRTVYVVGPDGRVMYRNMKFNALDPTHYAELGSAVRAARGG
ncbi:MAG TPA: peroxiredoxin [Gemmatimonadales bacterium]|nr:peroxiredoxin [Gemmatimonadales bacterium]